MGFRRNRIKVSNGKFGKKSNGESAHLAEEPPDFIARLVEETLDFDEKPRIVASSDLQPDGRYGVTWVLATERRVILIDPNHGSPHLIDLPLSDFREIRSENFVGGGSLRFVMGQSFHEVRFSQAHGSKFDDVAEIVETLRKEAGSSAAETEAAIAAVKARAEERAHESGRCPKCARVLKNANSVCPVCLPKAQLLMRLSSYLKPYWLSAILNFALMFAVTGLGLIPPYFLKVLLDDVFPHRNWSLFSTIMLLMVAVHAAKAVVEALHEFIRTWLKEKIVMGMRTQLYDHVNRLSLGFYDRFGTGRILHRIMNDTEKIHTFIANGMQKFAQDIMTVLIICGILFWMNWRLALVTLIPVPFIVFGTRAFGRWVRRFYRRVSRRMERLSSTLSDAIPGVRVVKAFGQEQREVDHFADLNTDLFSTTMTVARTQSIVFPGMDLLTVLGTVAVWGYGGYLVMETGGLGVGALFAFIIYLFRFYEPVNRLSRLTDNMQQVATAAQRIFEVLDTKPRVHDEADAVKLSRLEGRIKFDRVSFGYQPGRKVLNSVSFEIEPGEMIGLVGPSGSGKSTLINLLCRFYDAEEGQVTIDGLNVRDVKLPSLRRQFGLVLQEPYLFQGTIANNIAYGLPEATSEQIIKSAIMANAHDFIMRMPDGYDTMAGERGSSLSGGERQRISIARAVLKDPRILVLDEATSSVDTETEAKIREAMERLIEGRTTLVIAHRFSTLRSADRLIVLDKGCVSEIGTHEELLAKDGGLFGRLWSMQMDESRSRVKRIKV